jgi:alpha-glucoside transport system substrate-binding protein
MKRLTIVTLGILCSMMLAACGGAVQQAATAMPAVATKAAEVAPTVQAVATAVTGKGADIGASAEGASSKGLTCLADAYNGKMKGTKVSMTGPLGDADAVKFENCRKAFEETTGITIEYVGIGDFEALIGAHMAAGTAPDVIDFPQPGLLAGFFKQGKVIPVTKFVPESWLKENYKQSWLDMATMTDPNGNPVMAGLWWRFNGKSLVWYPKKAFDDAGYTIPTTWDELLKLDDQIVAAGDTPWCIGIGSGAATGWPATDWTEDLMLRTTSPENYDRWVKGELKFDSPEVKKAIETFAPIWNDDKTVYGGKSAIVPTRFENAPAPMFQDPPKCWLHRQGNFITTSFPRDAKPEVDYGVFYFPPVDPQYGKPFLVAGDIVAATQDRPEVCAVMQYFSTAAGVEGWLAAGGALGPQNDVTLEMYGVPLERSIAELASQATTIRFDASDMMPGAVGTGSFWKGMTAYFSGAASLDAVLKEIDASWPRESTATPSPESTGQDEMALQDFDFTSQALAGNLLGEPATRRIHVLLPPGYATSEERYPVVYVLHYFRGNSDTLLFDFRRAIESAHKAGDVRDMILVFPDAKNKLGGGWYLDSPTTGGHETYIVRELVDYMDSRFRTIPQGDSRGITGCSMGGDGALHLALKYPDVFGVAVSISGSYDWANMDFVREDAKLFTEVPQDVADFVTLPFLMQVYVSRAAAAAPNPDNPPFFLDMPFVVSDGTAQPVAAVWEKIGAVDPVHDAMRYAKQSQRLRGLMLLHGAYDTTVPKEWAQRYDKLLTDLEIEHTYLEVDGGHCEMDYAPVLKFISEHLAPATTPTSTSSDTLLITEPINMELVRVPAGEFVMGSDPAADTYAGKDDQP